MKNIKSYLLVHSMKYMAYFFLAMMFLTGSTVMFEYPMFLDKIISYLFWLSMGLYFGSLITKSAIRSLNDVDDVNTFLGYKK